MAKLSVVLLRSILWISVINKVIRQAVCDAELTRTCRRSVRRTISYQFQLDEFLTNVSFQQDSNSDTCVHLLLSAGTSFKLDVLQLMSIRLGINGSLSVMGNSVDINCTSDTTDAEELRSTLQPISRALLVLFDGLVFTKCPVPIVMEEVANVIIQNCVFLDHEHGALHIFNSPNVIVKNCTFYNNVADTFITRPYQGNAGGLSIGYNDRVTTMPLDNISVIITNCNFTNNHAVERFSPHIVQEERLFSGRGGGLIFLVNITGRNHLLTCTVNNSVFVNNSVTNLGGAMYMFSSETSNLDQIYVYANNVFIRNQADHGGGILTSNEVESRDYSLNRLIYNCSFIDNRAMHIGGGIYMYFAYGFGSDFIKLEECTFSRNTAIDHGGAFDAVSLNLYGNRQLQHPVEFVKCAFDDNFASSGATISFNYYSGSFNDVIFSNHTGPVLRVVAGNIAFNGVVKFVDNDAKTFDGGALYLLSFSQFTLHPGAHLDFTNNAGRTGAAIVVNSRYIIPSVFENSYFNPLCFLQYYSSVVPPSQWYQVSMNFTENKAVIGSTIYSSGIALCSWFSYYPPHFNASSGLRWPFISYGNRNINTGHGQNHSTDESFAVQTPAVNFVVMNETVAAYPGESIKLVIISYDEQNFVTSDTIEILESVQSNEFSLTFTPTARPLQPADPTFYVRYKLRSRSINNRLIFKNTYTIRVSALRTRSSQVQYFNLTVTPCPPGHAVYSTNEENEYECQCDDDNDANIVSCLPEQSSVVLMEGYWAHHVDDGSINGILEYYQCPPGYCQCSRMDNDSSRCNNIYYYDNDDLQCVCDRKGYLCGQCGNGKGVSALLNNCVSCERASILLIIALVIVDVILIIIILLSSLSLKPWLYPFLFYLQVTPYITLDFPVTFSAVQPYLYYISSATSLYFPYDFCLYPGMTALVSYSFRYIPFVLSVIISLIIYTANRYFKIGRSWRLSWSALWILIMLTSTNVLNTSVSILNCPNISDSKGNKNLRWFIDGSVKCFAGGHLPLAIMAMLILIFYVLLIIFAIAIAMKKIKRYWALSMTTVLRDPYSTKYYWWAPFELVRRLLFILLINIVPGNLALLLLLMMTMITLYIFTMPYRKLYINLSESFILADLAVLLMIATTEQFKDHIFKSFNYELLDDCGKVNAISEHVTMMIPFYYAPLLVLLIVLVAKFLMKLKFIYKTSDHEHGALNIFNSQNVLVKNCTFNNNTSSSYFTRQPFQGNAGGLSIGYNSRLATASLSHVNVTVTDCTFRNNRAAPPTALQLSPTDLQSRRIFSGRGGGLSIVINITSEIHCALTNSEFINNFAENFGGAFYVFISESSTMNHFYMFENNIFKSNGATYGGACTFVRFSDVIIPEEFNQTARFQNCSFINNTARNGGGLHVLPSSLGLAGSFISFVKCKFIRNTATDYAGVFDIVSYNFYGSREHLSPVEFQDCEFDRNFGADGATISLSFYSGSFDNVTFTNHRGPVVRGLGSTLFIKGTVVFTNNDAETFDGGAIYLLSFSHIVLSPGAKLHFINNTGRNGAAIVVNSQSILPLIFERNYFNRLCFIQYSNSYVPPSQWDQVSINFTRNKAVIGSAIYTMNVALCSWSGYTPPYFYNNTSVLRWPFMSFRDNNNTGHDEDFAVNGSLAVQTPAVDFIISNQTIAAYPGELIKLTVLSYDEQNYPTSDAIKILGESISEDYSLQFTPTASSLQSQSPIVNVTYSVKAAKMMIINDEILRSTHRISISAEREDFSQMQYFNLTIIPCPPGHMLLSTDEEDEYVCQCNNDGDENIISCLPEESKIVLEEGYWAHHIDDGSINGVLEYYQCPPGYCQCGRVDNDSSRCNSIYYYDNDDLQCVCDREGYLCGQCRNGKGVSALLNNCVSCERASILLIIALVIVDVMLIIIILLSSLSLKPWLYPFLFYLQITPYFAQYFPVTFSAVQPYLYYISSATSLYFPYDFCLYPGMTALVSYSLRYIPFVLSVIISLIIYTANRKFKIARKMRLSWSALWLLILLISTDVLNTSVSILNCPSLSDSSGNKNLRWFVDGSVKCFTGGHLPLAIVAMLVLIVYVLLVTFIIAIVLKLIKKHWAFSMAHILYMPYNNHYYWWAPVELIKRGVFVILIVIVPGNLSILFLPMMGLLALYEFTKPYRMFHVNLLESIVLADTLLLLLIASTDNFKDGISSMHQLELTNECGDTNTISDHVALMVPFYYLPLVLALIVLAVKFAPNLKVYYRKYLAQYRFKSKLPSSSSSETEYESVNRGVKTHYFELTMIN